MRKIIFTVYILLLVSGFVTAQDEPTPYEIALQRIEEARQSGAIELDLSRLGLSELPPEIGQLRNLRMLVLNFNELRALPVEIVQLTNLTNLYLADNALNEFPSEIIQLTNLQVLHLHDNNVTELPPEIGNLSQLGWLTLGGNFLRELPMEMGKLENLYELVVDDEVMFPPPEIIDYGTSAIVRYLRNEYEQREAEKQRLLVMGVSGVGLLAALMLGFRMKQRGQRKPKQKRDSAA
jgi:internalin A